MCDGLVRHALDHIYVPTSYGTQSNISTILNSKIQMSHELFATHDKDCVDQVFRVMCRYYLPPCGNFTHPLPPSSICQEECVQVQSKCPETWQTARVLLDSYPFINCDDTSQLLFPLPNCCTGAGILKPLESSSAIPIPTRIVEPATPTPDIGSIYIPCLSLTHITACTFSSDVLPQSGVDGGTVAGAVIGTLVALVLVAIAVVVVLAMISRKLRKKKQFQMMQVDILAL